MFLPNQEGTDAGSATSSLGGGPPKLPSPSVDEKWISKTATYRLSSNNPYHNALPSFLTCEGELHSIGGEAAFAFHTAGSKGDFVVIDLGRICEVSRIWIENRKDSGFEQRVRGLSVWLSTTADEKGDKTWSAPNYSATWDFSVPKMKARYIRICLPDDPAEPLHLAHAKVFGLAGSASDVEVNPSGDRR